MVGGAWCYLPQAPKEQYRGSVEGVVSGAWRGLTRPLSLWTDSGRGWRGRVEGLNQAAQSDAD